MFGLTRDKALVGLDIGSYAVKALELRSKTRGKRDAYEVHKVGYETLPHDAIVEGTIIDSAAVAEAISSLFEKSKITAKDVVLSVSGNSVIVKKITLPAMETEELAESIIWEAKHNIPYPYEETNVDYAILKPPDGETRNLEILLVAVKKDKIAAYGNVISQARKSILAVEVDAFALYNALEINYPEEFSARTVALVNVGANNSTIVISEKGIPQLFRDLTVGGLYFTENIRKDLSLSREDAEGVLRGVFPKSIPPGDIEAVLDMNVKGLLEEIEKTFAFYQAEDKTQKKIEQIYVSGGLASLGGLAAAFDGRFKINTMVFDPFRRIDYNEKKLDPAWVGDLAPSFAVAAGLASRKREK